MWNHRPLAARCAAGLFAVFVVFAVACGATVTASQSSSLDGVWTTRSSGVAASLTLKWTADSVTGSGTYVAFDNVLGCGGGTLKGSGTMTFAAARSQSSVTGYMKFDNGWTPPYIGTLEDNARINGGFMSIDRGPCPFTFIFGLTPRPIAFSGAAEGPLFI
jgi:hypothetical protein